MSSRSSLAALTILGLQLTIALSLHIPIPLPKPSNHTLTTILSSSASTRPNPFRNGDWDGVECFDHRVLPISLTLCEPTFRELLSRPDVDAKHTYGGRKQERVPIVGAPCAINLYGERYGGITVMTYREIVHYVRVILQECEEKRMGVGGQGYIGIDWWIEVYGALRRPGGVKGLGM